MPSAPDIDVLILGAGPAGLATAIAAAQLGLAVTVADASFPPFDKACGEGLMPESAALLAGLGVPLASIPHHRFSGIQFLQDGTSRCTARFPSGAGFGVRRTTLSASLLARARDLGVDFRFGHRLRAVTRTDTRLDARFDNSTLRARFLVGADGTHSAVRRLSNLPTPRIRSRRIGLRQHFRLAPWSSSVEVHWAPGLQAYVTPVAHDEVGVAILTRGSGSDFAQLVSRFPALARRLHNAAPASTPRGSVTLHATLPHITRGNIALVGDAAGTVDAITGMGVSLAFSQAQALATAIHLGDLSPYTAAHRKLFRLPRLMSHAMLLMDRSPLIRRRTFAAFDRHPELFQSMLSLHTADTLPPLLGPGGILHLGFQLLRA